MHNTKQITTEKSNSSTLWMVLRFGTTTPPRENKRVMSTCEAHHTVVSVLSANSILMELFFL